MCRYLPMRRWLCFYVIVIGGSILEDIAPDAERTAKPPGGNWYQLVGSSYDRTIYGFEIETTI